MDPNPRPHRTISRIDHHDFKNALGPGEFERLEVHGAEFQPGAGVQLSDDRTDDWKTHPKDVTVLSQSRIVVERAAHGAVPAGDGPGREETGPVAAALRVTVTCPNLPPVINSSTIAFI
jgi:hypothetical protein